MDMLRCTFPVHVKGSEKKNDGDACSCIFQLYTVLHLQANKIAHIFRLYANI
jgi:hypothetical protein